MFSLKYFCHIFFIFIWYTSPSCISVPSDLLKHLSVYSSGKLEVHLSSPFFSSLSGKVFQGSFLALPAKHGIVSLSASVLKGIDSDTLAMCAICSCLCGDRMAPNMLPFLVPSGHGRCQSPWQRPNYSHGKRLCQTAPRAQPLFDCPTSVSMQKSSFILPLSLRCKCVWSPSEVREWYFFGRADKEANTIISFRCYFRAFSTYTSSVFCIFLLDDEQRCTQGCDVGNKTCWRSGFGNTTDHDEKSCTIFKTANNGGGEWGERRVKEWHLICLERYFIQSRSIACVVMESNLVPRVETQLFNALHKVYCIFQTERLQSTKEPFTVLYSVISLFQMIN